MRPDLRFLPSPERTRRCSHGLNPVMATLLGMLTGIGGGMARDHSVELRFPTVLRADLYAVAASGGCGDRGDRELAANCRLARRP